MDHPQDGERTEKPARRFITPFGSFAVAEDKRRVTVNDDEALFDRETRR